MKDSHWYFVRVKIKKRGEKKDKKKSRGGQEAQDVITRGGPLDIQIRPLYTSAKKIYAHARVYAPGVIKGVNDGRGKSHNPLLFADLSVFRDASSGALSNADAMNERWHNKGWEASGTLDAILPLFTSSPICSLSNTRAHTHNCPQYTKKKKCYQTLVTAVNDFRIFPFWPTDKYLKKRRKKITLERAKQITFSIAIEQSREPDITIYVRALWRIISTPAIQWIPMLALKSQLLDWTNFFSLFLNLPSKKIQLIFSSIKNILSNIKCFISYNIYCYFILLIATRLTQRFLLK